MFHTQGDFNHVPYEECTFDKVYAIEATCHSDDLSKVYGEAYRVLKPGGMFAVYEWAMTSAYDPENAHHVKLKEDILVSIDDVTNFGVNSAYKVGDGRCLIDRHELRVSTGRRYI